LAEESTKEKKKDKEHKEDKANIQQTAELDTDQEEKNKEMEAHADQVRNEGVEVLKANKQDKQAGQEVDLEIEAPGAATVVAEEGSKTISTDKEYL